MATKIPLFDSILQIALGWGFLEIWTLLYSIFTHVPINSHYLIHINYCIPALQVASYWSGDWRFSFLGIVKFIIQHCAGTFSTLCAAMWWYLEYRAVFSLHRTFIFVFSWFNISYAHVTPRSMKYKAAPSEDNYLSQCSNEGKHKIQIPEGLRW